MTRKNTPEMGPARGKGHSTDNNMHYFRDTFSGVLNAHKRMREAIDAPLDKPKPKISLPYINIQHKDIPK